MVDDELTIQLHEISGTPLVTCDLCGQPVDRVTTVATAAGETGTASDQPMRLCSRCYGQVERGELPVPIEDDDLGFGTGF